MTDFLNPGPNAERIIDRLTKDMIAKGLLIQAGFQMYRAVTPGLALASKEHLAELEFAYFAGAQHLFASIMTVLDAGEEPTEADLKRIENIGAELEEFAKGAALRYTPARGRT